VALLLVYFSFGAAACGPSPEQVERERVLHALDALRDSPAADRPGRRKLIADLETQSAVVPAAARARDTCALAYKLLLEGTELQESVRGSLEKGEPTAELGARLLAAQAKIQQSGTVMADCERAAADLRLPARR
jgi:hypothetical protein